MTYGLSALLCGVVLVMVIGIICVWNKCARRPFKDTARLSSPVRFPRGSKGDPEVRTPSAKWSAGSDNVPFSFAKIV